MMRAFSSPFMRGLAEGFEEEGRVTVVMLGSKQSACRAEPQVTR